MITARRFVPGHGWQEVATADISEVRDETAGVLWVDAVDESDDELALLRQEFDLHPLALEDAHRHGQRPKLERYPSHIFVVVYSASLAEVDLFAGPHWLVTVREGDGHGKPWDPKPALEEFERTAGTDTTSSHLLHAVLDTIVDEYFDAFDQAEDVLERLEDDIFDDSLPAEKDVQRRLFDIRRRLLQFRRRVVPMREVLAAILRREVPWIDGDDLLLYQDVYDHVLRAVDVVDSARELMGNAVDAHLALISNRMNRVMKRMTSWGAILFGAALITGIYGMNFEHMPELQWYYGYPMALGMMLVLTVTLYWWFRKRDWL